jgi:hypothetical protein
MDRAMGALTDFETFLSKLGTIPEDRIKFYIHWVRRFLKSCNYQLDNIPVKKYWIPPYQVRGRLSQARNDNQTIGTFEAMQ